MDNTESTDKGYTSEGHTSVVTRDQPTAAVMENLPPASSTSSVDEALVHFHDNEEILNMVVKADSMVKKSDVSVSKSFGPDRRLPDSDDEDIGSDTSTCAGHNDNKQLSIDKDKSTGKRHMTLEGDGSAGDMGKHVSVSQSYGPDRRLPDSDDEDMGSDTSTYAGHNDKKQLGIDKDKSTGKRHMTLEGDGSAGDMGKHVSVSQSYGPDRRLPDSDDEDMGSDTSACAGHSISKQLGINKDKSTGKRHMTSEGNGSAGDIGKRVSVSQSYGPNRRLPDSDDEDMGSVTSICGGHSISKQLGINKDKSTGKRHMTSEGNGSAGDMGKHVSGKPIDSRGKGIGESTGNSDKHIGAEPAGHKDKYAGYECAGDRDGITAKGKRDTCRDNVNEDEPTGNKEKLLVLDNKEGNVTSTKSSVFDHKVIGAESDNDTGQRQEGFNTDELSTGETCFDKNAHVDSDESRSDGIGNSENEDVSLNGDGYNDGGVTDLERIDPNIVNPPVNLGNTEGAVARSQSSFVSPDVSETELNPDTGQRNENVDVFQPSTEDVNNGVAVSGINDRIPTSPARYNGTHGMAISNDCPLYIYREGNGLVELTVLDVFILLLLFTVIIIAYLLNLPIAWYLTEY